MKTYNMNDTVYFKLTEKGKEIWEEDNKRMKILVPSIDWKIKYYDGEWVKNQLWGLFQMFGEHVVCGADCYITDITFDDPLKAGE